MDGRMAEKLEKRARTMLPPATVMCLECTSDATGDEALAALLEEVQQKGISGEDLCEEPCEVIRFEDRILLRCAGCERAKTLPRFAGTGRGRTPEEARRNALYALTLSADHPNSRRTGCLAAFAFGEGPEERVEYACLFNRAAYEKGLP